MKRFFPLAALLAVFLLFILDAPQVSAGVYAAMELWARTLFPTLFPLFVLSRLISALGLPPFLQKRAGKLMKGLFRLPAVTAEVFILGLCGGYPLGADLTAQLRRKGFISKDEAERLLALGNNSGPAFIIGAAGGALHSVRAGIILYITHVLSAVLVGVLLRRRGASVCTTPTEPPGNAPLGSVFPSAVSGALNACLHLGAYVCFFGAVAALFGGFTFLPLFPRTAVLGFMELSSGIAALGAFRPSPAVMALAGFFLGWGGISVQLQTLGAVAGTDISCARHLAGRALSGGFSALISFFAGLIIY